MAKTATKEMRGVLLQQWNDLGEKVSKLGGAIPAAGFETPPVDGVRSAGEVLRHLVFWNRWLAASARGESPDGSANEIARSEAPNRARALAAFEESVAEAAAPLARGEDELNSEFAGLYASFLGHTSEHYGQLAVYARLAGVVPPASR